MKYFLDLSRGTKHIFELQGRVPYFIENKEKASTPLPHDRYSMTTPLPDSQFTLYFNNGLLSSLRIKIAMFHVYTFAKNANNDKTR